MKKTISIVTPFFNEEQTIAHYFSSLFKVIAPIKDYSFEILCINDGSQDNTLHKLLEFREKDVAS